MSHLAAPRCTLPLSPPCNCPHLPPQDDQVVRLQHHHAPLELCVMNHHLSAVEWKVAHAGGAVRGLSGGPVKRGGCRSFPR